MTLSLFIGLSVLAAAASLGALERLMNPDMKRFPCVNGVTIWVLRTYTVFLAFAAFDRLAREEPLASMIRATWAQAVVADPLEATIYQAGAALSMAIAHTTLLVIVMRLRLNKGVWPRLQARYRAAARANKVPGEAGAVLARKAAGDPTIVIGAPDGIPADFAPVLNALVDRD